MDGINFYMSGGAFNKKVRYLKTFVIHPYSEGANVGKFYITDDRDVKYKAGPYPTIERAIKAHEWIDNKRTMLI